MNEAKTTVLLEHHLKALKLPTVLREYVPVAAACSQDKADYATYLLRLTERELLDRERRAADRRLQAAKLPVVKVSLKLKVIVEVSPPLRTLALGVMLSVGALVSMARVVARLPPAPGFRNESV